MKTHFDTLKYKNESRIVVITHSTHEDFSDFPILFPTLTKNKKVRESRTSLKTKELYVDLTVSYLNSFLDDRDDMHGASVDKEVDGVNIGKAAIDYLENSSKPEWNSNKK